MEHTNDPEILRARMEGRKQAAAVVHARASYLPLTLVSDPEIQERIRVALVVLGDELRLMLEDETPGQARAKDDAPTWLTAQTPA